MHPTSSKYASSSTSDGAFSQSPTGPDSKKLDEAINAQIRVIPEVRDNTSSGDGTEHGNKDNWTARRGNRNGRGGHYNSSSDDIYESGYDSSNVRARRGATTRYDPARAKQSHDDAQLSAPYTDSSIDIRSPQDMPGRRADASVTAPEEAPVTLRRETTLPANGQVGDIGGEPSVKLQHSNPATREAASDDIISLQRRESHQHAAAPHGGAGVKDGGAVVIAPVPKQVSSKLASRVASDKSSAWSPSPMEEDPPRRSAFMPVPNQVGPNSNRELLPYDRHYHYLQQQQAMPAQGPGNSDGVAMNMPEPERGEGVAMKMPTPSNTHEPQHAQNEVTLVGDSRQVAPVASEHNSEVNFLSYYERKVPNGGTERYPMPEPHAELLEDRTLSQQQQQQQQPERYLEQQPPGSAPGPSMYAMPHPEPAPAPALADQEAMPQQGALDKISDGLGDFIPPRYLEVKPKVSRAWMSFMGILMFILGAIMILEAKSANEMAMDLQKSLYQVCKTVEQAGMGAISDISSSDSAVKVYETIISDKINYISTSWGERLSISSSLVGTTMNYYTQSTLTSISALLDGLIGLAQGNPTLARRSYMPGVPSTQYYQQPQYQQLAPQQAPVAQGYQVYGKVGIPVPDSMPPASQQYPPSQPYPVYPPQGAPQLLQQYQIPQQSPVPQVSPQYQNLQQPTASVPLFIPIPPSSPPSPPPPVPISSPGTPQSYSQQPPQQPGNNQQLLQQLQALRSRLPQQSALDQQINSLITSPFNEMISAVANGLSSPKVNLLNSTSSNASQLTKRDSDSRETSSALCPSDFMMRPLSKLATSVASIYKFGAGALFAFGIILIGIEVAMVVWARHQENIRMVKDFGPRMELYGEVVTEVSKQQQQQQQQQQHDEAPGDNAENALTSDQKNGHNSHSNWLAEQKDLMLKDLYYYPQNPLANLLRHWFKIDHSAAGNAKMWYLKYIVHGPTLSAFIVGVIALCVVLVQIAFLAKLGSPYMEPMVSELNKYAEEFTTKILSAAHPQNSSQSTISIINANINMLESTLGQTLSTNIQSGTAKVSSGLDQLVAQYTQQVNAVFVGSIVQSEVTAIMQSMTNGTLQDIKNVLSTIQLSASSSNAIQFPKVTTDILQSEVPTSMAPIYGAFHQMRVMAVGTLVDQNKGQDASITNTTLTSDPNSKYSGGEIGNLCNRYISHSKRMIPITIVLILLWTFVFIMGTVMYISKRPKK